MYDLPGRYMYRPPAGICTARDHGTCAVVN